MNAFRALCVAILFSANAAAGLEVGLGSELQTLTGGRMIARSLLAATSTTSTKKSPAKKSPAKKSPAKKSPPKKSPAKKSPAKKSPAKKSPAKKSPAKQSPPKTPVPVPGAGGKTVVKVGAGGLSVFKPEKIAIVAGATVEFVLDSMGHNVVFTKVPAGADKGKLSNTKMSLPETEIGYKHTVVFTVPGEYEYLCLPHAGIGMAGYVTVK